MLLRDYVNERLDAGEASAVIEGLQNNTQLTQWYEHMRRS